MKTYHSAMEIGEGEIIFVDFDVENPACKDDPFVRVGVVDHYPLTHAEYAKFLCKHEVVGKMSDVFPNGACGQDDLFNALNYAREQQKWQKMRIDELWKS